MKTIAAVHLGWLQIREVTHVLETSLLRFDIATVCNLMIPQYQDGYTISSAALKISTGLDMTRAVKKVYASDVVQMHHLASVIDMSIANGKLLSIGYDASLRLMDTQTHSMCGGGKIGKRLPEDTYLTTCFLDYELLLH